MRAGRAEAFRPKALGLIRFSEAAPSSMPHNFHVDLSLDRSYARSHSRPESCMPIANAEMKTYLFLQPMYDDNYFPAACVDKVKQVLVGLCERIEREKPADLAGLYRLTHAATEQVNELQDDFAEHDSEIETAAREAIAEDFARIAAAYGFNADVEELIATRDW
jgi:hypothetical protein